jgi:predicted nuclease of restriction endonuclease-like (RecB) superfamily
MTILSGCDTKEEREFYIQKSISEWLSSRVLERQIDSLQFE